MNDKNLGSASVGFEVDLKALQGQLNQAARMIGGLQNQAQKQTQSAAGAGGGGGILGALIGNSKQAGLGLSLIGNFAGPLGRLGTAVGGVGRLFGSMGAAAGAAGVGLGAMIPVVGAIALAVGAAVIAVKGFTLAMDQMKQATLAAGDQQALNTSFDTMVQNLGLSEGKVAGFRQELEKMSFTTDQQTAIMQGLTRALGANGLSSSALQAVAAMRDLSVVAGQSTQQGVTELTHALTTLNPQLLDQYGITQTATQIFDQYGATLGKTHDQMSSTEKQQAILNAVMGASAASAGVADRAANDLNRSATRLEANFKSLQAGIGQAFLPLASGIVSMINTEVLGMSNSVDDNRNKFEALGQTIANRVIPIVSSFIQWVKNLPWKEIVNGAYITAQFLQILGRALIGSGRAAVAMGKMAFASLRVVAAAITAVIGTAQLGISVLANFWNVLSGKTSVGQAAQNLKNEASALYGTVWEEMAKGFNDGLDALGDYGDAAVDTWKGYMQDFKDIGQGFDIGEFFANLPAGLEGPAAEVLDDWKNTTGGMSREAMKAAQKMAQDLAKENADFARNQANALRDYQSQLADLVAGHRDRIDDLRKDINKEVNTFQKAQAERARDYDAEIAKLTKADDERKNDVNKQIAEELAKGRFADQTKLAQLRSRLAFEDAAHQEAVAKANETYVADTTNATTQHQERLAEIQSSLDEELAIQQRHASDFATYRDHQIADDITKLKEQYVLRKAETDRAHAERIQDIIRQGAEAAGQAGLAGTNEGLAAMGGLAGGINAGKGPALNAAKLAGQQAGDNTGAGITEKQPQVSRSFGGMLKDVAAGAAVGSIFGPVGTLIGGVIGAAIPGTAGAIGGFLKQTFESAVNVLKAGWDFGKKIIGTMGKAIHDALPWGVSGGFKSAWNGLGLPAYAQGGIVGGVGGVDANMAAVTKGEMILNRDQQKRMFSMLDGRVAPGGSGSTGGNMIIENLSVSLPSVRNGDDFVRDLQLKFATLRTA